MSSRRPALLLVALGLGFTLAWPVGAQIPGRNVNMVSGLELPFGDPFLQRQNEPECAVSTRNPRHLLCVANDYRTVDLPGSPDEAVKGDAWIGVFMSFDGGESWISTLLPGFPQDGSAEGQASPLHGFEFGADPLVEAGPNGVFHVVGLVANRDESASAVFAARYIDNNNKENGVPIKYVDATLVVEGSGSDGFVDKPALAVDVPRDPTTATVTVPRDDDPAEIITQEIACGPVHVAYANFMGSEAAGTLRSQILTSRSTDCGESWSVPLRIDGADPEGDLGGEERFAHALVLLDALIETTEETADAAGLSTGDRDALLSKLENARDSLERGNGNAAKGQLGAFIDQVEAFNGGGNPRLTDDQADPLVEAAEIIIDVIDGIVEDRGEIGIPNQGAAIGIDPDDGSVYTAWRQFGTDVLADAIFVAHSGDRGQSYGSPVEVAQIDPFDQGTSIVSFRTNSFPDIAVDGEGVAYLAYATRGVGPSGDARVVIHTSRGGASWSGPVPVDDHDERGHQFMPSMALAAGKLTVVFFDARDDVSGRFEAFIDDTFLPRHTVDVRVAQADPGEPPAFDGSVRASRYLHVLPGSDTLEAELARLNPPNFPLFRQGTAAFMGDYVDVTASTMRSDGSGGWVFNLDPDDGQLFHAAWADNRDVREPVDGDWSNYTPPDSEQPPEFDTSVTCDADRTGMRNQNVYSSAIAQGVAIGSPANTKPLSIQRAFVVFAENVTDEPVAVRMEIVEEPADGQASFLQFEDLDALDMVIPSFSLVARTVYVTAGDTFAPVVVEVSELDVVGGSVVGSLGTVLLNPDPTNPDLVDPDIQDPNIVNPNIVNVEVYNPNIRNPNIRNVANPNIVNPNIVNPNIVNPNIVNPNIVNPDLQNPNIVNPNIRNPNIRNEAIGENAGVTDVEWEVQNTGNTSAGYSFKMLSDQGVPDGIQLQLLVTRVFTNPAALECDLEEEVFQELMVNVVNPAILDPDADITSPNIRNAPEVDNATFFLAPDDTALVTLRIFDPDVTDDVTFDPEDVAGAVVPQAVNTDAEPGSEPQVAANLLITTTTLPQAPLNGEYSQTIETIGGIGELTFSVVAGSLPPGLALDAATGVISGTATEAGTFEFTVEVTDEGDPQQNDDQAYSLVVAAPDGLSVTETKFTTGGEGDNLGEAVAIDGDVALAGATGQTALGTDDGEVVVFRRTDGVWELETALEPTDGEAGDRFGAAVAIDGDVAIIGAPGEDTQGVDAGAAYVFRVAGGAWQEEAKLTADDGHAGSAFGSSVGISDGVIVAGAPDDDEAFEDDGSAYVFMSTDGWQQQAKLTASDADALDGFGGAVAASDDAIVVGSNGDDDNGDGAGAAYVFRLDGDGWTEEAKLLASTGAEGDNFGNAVSIDGNTVLVGANLDDDLGDRSGAAFVFEREGSGWVESALLTAEGGGSFDEFGRDVGLGSSALIGRPLGSSNSAEVFRKFDGVWETEVSLRASDAVSGDDFGIAVAMSGDTAMVAAPFTDDNGVDSGAVYFFELAGRELFVDTNFLPDGVVDTTYSETLQATGGVGDLTWDIFGGSLPDGLGLDAASGVISGTPTVEGTFEFTVEVADSGDPQQTDTQDLSITVEGVGGSTEPLEITTTSVPAGVVGFAYEETLEVTGGTPPTSWSLAAGSGPLPDGLRLGTDTGTISGTPTTEGTFDFIVQAADSGDPQQVSTQTLSITVSSGLRFVTQPQDVIGDVAFTVQVEVQDADGQPVPGVTVELSLGQNDTGGSLSGSTTVDTDASGIAEFAGLSIDRGGVYTLVASRNPSVESDPFDVEGFFPLSALMAEPRADHTATRLVPADGRVLVAGGQGGGDGTNLNSSAELFDPLTDTFTVTGPLQVERSAHTATLLPDGRVLVVGGSGGATTSAETFDPADGTFTEITDTVDFRIDHTATQLDAGADGVVGTDDDGPGRVLVTGGSSSGLLDVPPGSTSPTAEIFDPIDGSFTLTDTMNEARMFHTATRLPDGRVLVVGGRTKSAEGDIVITSGAEIFDPAADGGVGAFISTGSMSVARERHTATSLPDGRVLITGGNDWDAGTFLSHDSAEIFDPSANGGEGGFTSVESSMVRFRTGHRATLLGDGSLVLLTGGDGGTSAEVFHVASETFRPTGAMIVSRENHAAALLLDAGADGVPGTADDGPGRVVILGGFDTQSAAADTPGPASEVDSAEIFHPIQ